MDTSKQTGVYAPEIRDVATALESIEIRLQRIYECLDERLKEIDSSLMGIVANLD